jgi:hypothetical protein
MSKRFIIVLISHRHKHLDLISICFRYPKRPKYSRIKRVFLTPNKGRYLEPAPRRGVVVPTLCYVQGKWKNKKHELLSLGNC